MAQQRTMYCRNCEANGIKTEIYFDNVHKSQSGKSIPLEKFSSNPHQCPYSPYAKKQDQQNMQPTTATYKYTPEQKGQFVDMYRPEQKQEQQQTNDFQLAQLITKVDNLNIGLAKVMSMIQTLNDLSMNAEDISRLRTENAELKDVLKNREDNFVPANKVKSDWVPEEDSNPQPEAEHVQDMVQKGKDEEELEI